jgi:mono/diheme cytochrome c family protein
MRRRSFLLAAVAVALAGGSLLWTTARTTTESLSRPAVSADATAEARGAAAFEGAGFGGVRLDALKTHALPWRLVAAALVLDAQARDRSAPLDRSTLDATLASFGFFPGAEVANRPPGVSKSSSELPLGFSYGDLAPIGGTKIRVANLGCASCHAGVTYRADGTSDPRRTWLGMPNTSLDLEAYTLAVFRATRSAVKRPEQLIAAIDVLFPDMDWRERQSLRWLVLPLVERRIAELGDIDKPLPFPNGAPGSTNGVAALKFALRAPLAGNGAGDAGVVSIPDLGSRVWRTSLLADGAYAVPGSARQAPMTASGVDDPHLTSLATIMTFFTVPSMGVHPDAALGNIAEAVDVMAFLRSYRPQPFPGAIDKDRAEHGRQLYAAQCAACHGRYDAGLAPRLVEFPNWIGDVGTDGLRAKLFDEPLAAAISRTGYASKIAVARGSNYAAPPLTGIWASAPYLHNGSVPTLASLLSPDTRPPRFNVGGHALDFEQVGLKLDEAGNYPAGYKPFSTPAVIDTATPGRSNSGHRFGEGLDAGDKRDLIAYLKLL